MERRRPPRRSKGKHSLTPQEARRLRQLLGSVILFFAVFLGRMISPDGFGVAVAETVRGDTDFKAAFTSVGEAIGGGAAPAGILGELYTAVFGASATLGPAGAGYEEAKETLADGLALTVVSPSPVPSALTPSSPSPSPSPEASAEPSAAPSPSPSPYNGPALPEKTTMEYVALNLDYAAPLVGEITSSFGWRDHPISGDNEFHYGIDIAADEGTPILAFASGTVDYIGESSIYGLYMQLRHTDGTTSFYAHCSKLLFRKEASVEKGEEIAEVGSTGSSTGTHLHFEIRKDGIYLNPEYYVN
ncbi:MAG TPA: M23 family metallopeptidase [Oscillospiraceae bacterium]|nr:M23 family metallopeptidase [Oscillospiraceae bacterium]